MYWRKLNLIIKAKKSGIQKIIHIFSHNIHAHMACLQCQSVQRLNEYNFLLKSYLPIIFFEINWYIFD